jgi:hypothetical protein
MIARETLVIGKQETLLRPGMLAPGELRLDWPDQGTSERNWALNSRLLDHAMSTGRLIRDAEVAAGGLAGDTGFLARERAQLRAAGFRLTGGGFWTRPARRPLVELARAWGARARAAAARGQSTFRVPEALPVAAWMAAVAARGGGCCRRDLRRRVETWRAAGAGYHDFVRLSLHAALAFDTAAPPFEPAFRAKVEAELEPMLALWPHVLVLPTTARLSASDLVELRAYPAHPLGLVDEATWADGELLAPSEYFFHDLDHARFKVREDFLARGVSLPDAYQDGSTVDPGTGRHRSILPFAVRRLGGWFGADVRARRYTARGLQLRAATLRDPATARAAELLLFEVLHEKGLPPVPPVLARAFADDAHVAKLQRKHAGGFFGAGGPLPEVVSALPAARLALAGACR